MISSKDCLKKLTAFFSIPLIVLLLTSLALAKSVKVKGSVSKKGTYRSPYYRTSPNKTKIDNWSTKGNVNPYTGKSGTVNPHKK